MVVPEFVMVFVPPPVIQAAPALILTATPNLADEELVKVVETSAVLVLLPARTIAVGATMPVLSVSHQQVENSSSSSDNRKRPASPSSVMGFISSGVKSRGAKPPFPGFPIVAVDAPYDVALSVENVNPDVRRLFEL